MATYITAKVFIPKFRQIGNVSIYAVSNPGSAPNISIISKILK
jgi:hypothetical protein